MLEQYMVEQFGIAVTNLNKVLYDRLSELDVDLIQLQLHLNEPEPTRIAAISDMDTYVIGKYVPPQREQELLLVDWRSRCGQLFLKYKNRIKIWDFAGEPETSFGQPGCRWFGDAQSLVERLQCFYEAGKMADSENLIGGCGFISSTFNGFFGNDDRSPFLREFFDRGGADFLDYISINHYIYGYGGEKNIYAGLWRVKSIMDRYQICKPVVIAEAGVPCAGDPKFLHIIQTPERQAQSLVRSYVLFLSIGIDYIVWFTLRYQGWGLVYGKNCHRRPAFYAYKNLIRLLKGSRYLRRQKAYPCDIRELTDFIEWHVFEKGDRHIHVIWLEHPHRLIRSFGSNFDVLDIYGAPVSGQDVDLRKLHFIVGSKHDSFGLLEYQH